MAMEESRVLIWHRDKLKLSIMTEPFLQTVFDHILGRDVVKKLMQVTQVFIKQPQQCQYKQNYSHIFTKHCKTYDTKRNCNENDINHWQTLLILLHKCIRVYLVALKKNKTFSFNFSQTLLYWIFIYTYFLCFVTKFCCCTIHHSSTLYPLPPNAPPAHRYHHRNANLNRSVKQWQPATVFCRLAMMMPTISPCCSWRRMAATVTVAMELRLLSTASFKVSTIKCKSTRPTLG